MTKEKYIGLTPAERRTARQILQFRNFLFRKYQNPDNKEMWRLLDEEYNVRAVFSIRIIENLIKKGFLNDSKQIIATVYNRYTDRPYIVLHKNNTTHEYRTRK